MAVVWYVLIHVSLALIAPDVFSFTNRGAAWAAVAAAVVQGYAMWEVHRLAWPRFRASLDAAAGAARLAEARRGYWKRLGRLYVFRISAFSILTLLVATIVRGAGA